MSGFKRACVAAACALFVFVAPAAAQVPPPLPTPFALVPIPIGVAATQNYVLVTQYDCSTIVQIDKDGLVTPFAALPTTNPICEMYIAIAPHAQGQPFQAKHVFVVQGDRIWEIWPDGTQMQLFTTIPGLPPTHNGITFDRVGTFGYNMIVTASTGQVYEVFPDGSFTLIATVPDFIEGPEVMPFEFGGPAAGQILVASEVTGTIWSVSSAGVVKPFSSYPAAEQVRFVPTHLCTFGESRATLFTAIFPTEVDFYPKAAFQPIEGQAIVTSEVGGGIGVLSNTGVAAPYSPDSRQHEGSSFVQSPGDACWTANGS